MREGAIETAYWLGELLEITPKEQQEIARLLDQHGTVGFWTRLNDWNFSNELLTQLRAVNEVLTRKEHTSWP
ncbi:hypothetical protein D3C81_2049520 [compost metagenome]